MKAKPELPPRSLPPWRKARRCRCHERYEMNLVKASRNVIPTRFHVARWLDPVWPVRRARQRMQRASEMMRPSTPHFSQGEDAGQ